MPAVADEVRWTAHESAIVEPDAAIGADTTIWHHAHVRSGAQIGTGCTIGKNVYVDAGAVLGDRVKVQNNVSVYRGVEIGDDVLLGPSCVFTNDRYPRATDTGWQVVPTFVRHGASVGANATIVCGVTIGEWATVGAGALVTHDVADHQLVLGVPARPSGWVCQCGQVVSRSADAPPAELRCARCRSAAS